MEEFSFPTSNVNPVKLGSHVKCGDMLFSLEELLGYLIFSSDH